MAAPISAASHAFPRSVDIHAGLLNFYGKQGARWALVNRGPLCSKKIDLTGNGRVSGTCNKQQEIQQAHLRHLNCPWGRKKLPREPTRSAGLVRRAGHIAKATTRFNFEWTHLLNTGLIPIKFLASSALLVR